MGFETTIIRKIRRAKRIGEENRISEADRREKGKPGKRFLNDILPAILKGLRELVAWALIFYFAVTENWEGLIGTLGLV